MTVHLTPEPEAFVEALVKTGAFPSADELVAAALLRLQEAEIDADEFDDEDLAALDEAERQISAGQDRDRDEAAAELRRKYLGT